MMLRFCAYGFLKNQRYFEPFLILAMIEWGLSFFAIGVLIAVREVATNLLEVASGAMADTWGRRRSMVLSFCAYLASLAIFAMFRHPLMLGAAMVLYGAGEAFRSGTHKAMILTWLRVQGRAHEKTEVYGYTRSWSKAGSALGVLLGSAWVITTGDLDALFWMAMIPTALDLANLATYPAYLEGVPARSSEQEGEVQRGSGTFAAAIEHLRATAHTIDESPVLKRLLLESSGFMGTFKTTKDYLQPVLLTAATAWAIGDLIPGNKVTGRIEEAALLVGPVYFGLFFVSALVSRRSGDFVRARGDEAHAATWLWRALACVWVVATVGAVTQWLGLLIAAFVALFVLESLWRPVLLARFDDAGKDEQNATLLSIESQARSATTMILAPILGALVDLTSHSSTTPDWLPVALLGMTVSAIGAWWPAQKSTRKMTGL